jgi:hypothetical protein
MIYFYLIKSSNILQKGCFIAWFKGNLLVNDSEIIQCHGHWQQLQIGNPLKFRRCYTVLDENAAGLIKGNWQPSCNW